MEMIDWSHYLIDRTSKHDTHCNSRHCLPHSLRKGASIYTHQIPSIHTLNDIYFYYNFIPKWNYYFRHHTQFKTSQCTSIQTSHLLKLQVHSYFHCSCWILPHSSYIKLERKASTFLIRSFFLIHHCYGGFVLWKSANKCLWET